MPTNPANSVPGWEGAVGPFEDQYGKLHVYARDVQSGAGNCVCGHALDVPRHVQAAPGVDIPGRVPPMPEYHMAWQDLQDRVVQAFNDGDELQPSMLLAYMKELLQKAHAPVSAWIEQKAAAQAPVRRKYVLAGNYQQFEFWCRENRINRHDQNVVRYCATEHHLLGLGKGFDIHIVGTFNERRDACRIREIVQAFADTYEDVQVYWE